MHPYFPEKAIFAPTDISIPTMISLNGRLFIVYSDEIETLVSKKFLLKEKKC